MIHSPKSGESLGRCCFDSEEAARERPRTSYVERWFHDGSVSVDLLGQGDIQYLSTLHTQEGQTRTPARTFHGWYIFGSNILKPLSWVVVQDCTKHNPWHAQIWSFHPIERGDSFRQQCQKIAVGSSWRPRPMPLAPNVERFLRDVTQGAA